MLYEVITAPEGGTECLVDCAVVEGNIVNDVAQGLIFHEQGLNEEGAGLEELTCRRGKQPPRREGSPGSAKEPLRGKPSYNFV